MRVLKLGATAACAVDPSDPQEQLFFNVYILSKFAKIFDGAVGLTSIHLAFYQMNPWLTAQRRILNIWNFNFCPCSSFIFAIQEHVAALYTLLVHNST